MDRRRGSERRSTLDRRGRVARRSVNAERPVEHVRNALQLLQNVNVMKELSAGPNEDLTTAIDRLLRAVTLLEPHSKR